MERTEEMVLNESGPCLKVTCVIRKSNRARRINLRVRSRDKAILTLPRWTSYREGYTFLKQQESWLDKNVRKFPLICSLVDYFSNGGRVWLSENYHLLVCSSISSSARVIHEISDDEIRLYLPGKKLPEEEIFSFLRGVAKKNLTERLHFLSKECGHKWSKVRIGNQKSRWGSCSAKGTISLNWRLVLLPYEIGNYVIYHELAHLIHLNHSAEFWSHLNDLCSNAKLLDKKLRKEGKSIISLGHQP
ncbi:MAG: M48 family metallopeptidase [Opitutae bacterium]|nr:M48 family metallopeptidase [Opitutae bacterium]MBT5717434.1 M48 family metallopeptidase [Opitutae bacterium]